jgi:hypothetical protein
MRLQGPFCVTRRRIMVMKRSRDALLRPNSGLRDRYTKSFESCFHTRIGFLTLHPCRHGTTSLPRQSFEQTTQPNSRQTQLLVDDKPCACIQRAMMLSRRNLSALVGDVVRNTIKTLAEAEWRAEMEHRLCSDIRKSEKKVNTAAESSSSLPSRDTTAVHMSRNLGKKQESRHR